MSERYAALVAAFSLFAAVDASAAGFAVAGGYQEMEIDLDTGLPSRWVSCDRVCTDADARRIELAGPGGGALRWPGAPPQAGGFVPSVERTAEHVRVDLRSAADERVVIAYELALTSARVALTLPAGVALLQSVGPAFQPDALPGFGAAFSDIERVRVGPAGQAKWVADAAPEVATGDWVGFRQRFWAWLVVAGEGVQADVAMPSSAAAFGEIAWRADSASRTLQFYAGPIEWRALAAVDAPLTGMLYASLWEPLRWLCRGLYEILRQLLAVVGSPGLAIILLSLVVKILLAPLSAIADRWQRDVNRIQSRIQPKIAAIKAEYRGEEAHVRTLAVYKEEGVHPLFTMKSLAGFAIQVPMFIAAFDMLADNIALAGTSFLWIADLAAPDRAAALPVALPFFGAHLNLLPACMTAISLLSAWLQRDATLNEALQRQQRVQLYGMAAAFFLLFYTFPSGMVLYWTANNFWHLVKEQVLDRMRRR